MANTIKRWALASAAEETGVSVMSQVRLKTEIEAQPPTGHSLQLGHVLCSDCSMLTWRDRMPLLWAVLGTVWLVQPQGTRDPPVGHV